MSPETDNFDYAHSLIDLIHNYNAGYSIFLNRLRKDHRQVSQKTGDFGKDFFEEFHTNPVL